jgi:hypothetical protein
MSKVFLSTVAAAALVATMTTAPAAAGTFETYDKLAYLTFNVPVQIPGTTLGAGTYRFHLANPSESRNVMQVLSEDGRIVYAMFHTLPDSRIEATDDVTITFKETPAGVAPVARSLFYGGELRGYEFVYPKHGPTMTPPIVVQPPITYTPILAAAIPEPVAAPEPAPVATPEPIPEPEPAPAPVELPKTATPLPLVALGGFVSLLAGLGLALIRKAHN